MTRGRLSVVLLTLCVLVVAGCAAQHSDAAAPSGSQLTGIWWTLSDLRSAGRKFSIPSQYRAEINFDDHGRISGINGPNAFDAHYGTSGQTITFSGGGSGAAGTAGINPVKQAMDSLYAPSGPAQINQDNTVECRYTVSSTSLRIDTPTWTLMFRNKGAH